MTQDNTVSGELMTFATSAPEVIGCAAQSIAAAAVMGLANQLDDDDPLSDWLFNNSEGIAGAVLRGLGISQNARAVAASTPSVDEEMLEALKQIAEWLSRAFEMPRDWSEQIANCPDCQGYAKHPIQQGICDTPRRPIWDRERHDVQQRELRGLYARDIARATSAAS